MSKIYIIQFKDSFKEDEFAISYEVAKSELERRGYLEQHALNEEENEAGIFEKPEDWLFAKSEARVISRNLIV